MRTYDELNSKDKSRAQNIALSHLLRDITEGMVRFRDKGLQGAIDKATARANAMHTPWFAHEYVIEATYNENGETITVADTLKGMALSDARGALYPEDGEYIIRL